MTFLLVAIQINPVSEKHLALEAGTEFSWGGYQLRFYALPFLFQRISHCHELNTVITISAPDKL